MNPIVQTRDVFREGLFARALGRSCLDNPYQEDSKEASVWIQGWWLIQDDVSPAEEFIYTHSLDVSPNVCPGNTGRDTRNLWHKTSLALRVVAALLLGVVAFLFSYSTLRALLP
jgi:hypothetical protein